MFSCGDTETPTTTATGAHAARTPAHQLPEETQQQIVADVKKDLEVIASMEKDDSVLAEAMTGEALAEMRSQAAADLAAGKYKKRDYREVKVELTGYTSPVAEVKVEFDNYGYYVDANSGKALETPSGEHVTLAMAVIEEDGRWEIKGIFSPESNGSEGSVAQ